MDERIDEKGKFWMAEPYSVAVSYGDDLGWIEYDEAAKKITVTLGSDEGKKKAEEIQVPHETLMDFTEETIEPWSSKENFQLALTRLWENTDVHVDWSRPVDYVKAHPHY